MKSECQANRSALSANSRSTSRKWEQQNPMKTQCIEQLTQHKAGLDYKLRNAEEELESSQPLQAALTDRLKEL